MTLPTVENSRLEDVKVNLLFWHQTSLIALVSFSNEQKLSKATWDSAGLHTPVQTGRMPRRPWRKRFAQARKRFAQKGKYLHTRGKDLHREEKHCTERKSEDCSPCHSVALWRECVLGAPPPGIRLDLSDWLCLAIFSEKNTFTFWSWNPLYFEGNVGWENPHLKSDWSLCRKLWTGAASPTFILPSWLLY